MKEEKASDEPKLGRKDYQPQDEGAQAGGRQGRKDDAPDCDSADDEENLRKIESALAASPVVAVTVPEAMARFACLKPPPILSDCF